MEFTTITLATVPAVIALVTLLKDLGLPSRLSPLAAVILGVIAQLIDVFAQGVVTNWYAVISTGVILGLSASGLYDGARLIGQPKENTEKLTNQSCDSL